jgi:hypothetical protein
MKELHSGESYRLKSHAVCSSKLLPFPFSMSSWVSLLTSLNIRILVYEMMSKYSYGKKMHVKISRVYLSAIVVSPKSFNGKSTGLID